MAVADMNKITFYNNSPLISSIRKPQNDLPRNKRVIFVNSFDDQPARLYNKSNSTSKRINQLKQSKTVVNGRDLTIQYKDGTVGLQGRNKNVVDSQDEAGNEILLDSTGAHTDNVGNGETQDSPIISKDDEPDGTGCESNIEHEGNASTVSSERDSNPCRILSSQGLPARTGEPIDPSGWWFDVDDGRYVYEKPFSSLGLGLYESLGPIPVQDSTLPLSPRPVQYQVHQREAPSPCILAEPGACHHHVDRKGTSNKNTTEYAEDPQLEQHNPPLAALPSFSHPRRSADAQQPWIGREHDSDDEERERQKDRRARDVEVDEIGTNVRHTQSSDCPHNASNEGIEVPRSVKRQKLQLKPIQKGTPPDEDSATPQVTLLDSVAANQPETDNSRLQAGYECLPTPMDDTRESRSTSTVQLAQVEADMDWEVLDIEGKEVVDGEDHYWVVWQPTLMPRHALGNSRELIKTFETRCEAQLKLKRSRPVSEPVMRAMAADALGMNQQKKRLGRPPKKAKRN